MLGLIPMPGSEIDCAKDVIPKAPPPWTDSALNPGGA
jgi:hypothetical protein